MNSEKKILEHRTTEVTEFLANSKDSELITLLVRKFNTALPDCSDHENSSPIFETIRTILCSFYQDFTKSSRYCRRKSEPRIICMYERYINSFKHLEVNKVPTILYANHQLNNRQSEYCDDISVLLDITDLYHWFYAKPRSIYDHFNRIQELTHQHLVKDNKVWVLDIKFMNCYLDSLLRRQKFSAEKINRHKASELFLKNVQLWLTLQQFSIKYEFLTLLLPKLNNVIPESDLLIKVWNMIHASNNDWDDKLNMIYKSANVWFPIQSDCEDNTIRQTLSESFWRLLLNGLSNDDWDRQASFLHKRILVFDEKYEKNNLKLDNNQESVTNHLLDSYFQKSLSNLLLILEFLDEEQKDFETQVFPQIKTLLNETFDQNDSKTEFYVAWMHGAFSRILGHHNNAVVKWGLINIFALDPELYGDNYLEIVLNALNEDELYENDTNGEEPLVMKELIRFLNYAKTKQNDLITRFLVQASRTILYSVPLFYIIHAIFVVKRLESSWKDTELQAIKSLAENNLQGYIGSEILQIGSEIQLLEIMSHFETESIDLMLVANALSAFLTDKALTRGELAWSQISVWLSKIVKRDEALSFLENICGKIKNENSENDLNVNTIALMIMFFYDGHLILNSKLCPGLTMLHNLLNGLTEVSSKPYANEELKNRLIELIGYLLDFTLPKDCIIREFISNYAEATLRFAFKNLRKISDEALVNNIDTYVLIAQKFFTADSSIITTREVLNHIERFEIEAWNIIEDGEYSNHVQRLFGIKILYVCLKARSLKLKNYRFMGPLYTTYKTPMQPSGDTEATNQTNNETRYLGRRIATDYYKHVAELFYEYVKDEPFDEWIPDTDWIEQVLYLVRTDSGSKILVPLVGILSQIFYKKAVQETDMDNFKTAMKLCWAAALRFNKCLSAVKQMMNLIYSSPFLECDETLQLAIEYTDDMLEMAEETRGLSIILVKGLKQVEGAYLSNFYGAVLRCLLHGTIPDQRESILLQAQSYVLDCYQALYPNYLSNLNANDDAATRAHAVILLHRMITSDTKHAIELLPLIVAKLDECLKTEDLGYLQTQRHKNRIVQVLLVLHPILENDDIERLYSLLCYNVLSNRNEPNVRIMLEWLLIRIYLQNETLRAKIWDLFDQSHEKHVDSLSSVVIVVYHVAKLLSSDLQLDFINLAFRYIMPCCMVQNSNVRLYAQVVASKLYHLATRMSYTTLTEKYSEFYLGITKSLKYEILMKDSTKLQHGFYLAVFDPIDDYSLQTIFAELPRLTNVPSDEYISPQMFEKFDFKRLSSHPLRLFNIRDGMKKVQVSTDVFNSSGTPSARDNSDNVDKEFIPWETLKSTANESFETFESCEKDLKKENDIIIVTTLIDRLPNFSSFSRTCEILGVKELVMSSIEHPENKEFRSFSIAVENLFPLTEVKPDKLEKYLAEKKHLGYRLVGADQMINSTNLMDVRFNEKTVLLIGNETSGIPAHLIPLLHEYVEIP